MRIRLVIWLFLATAISVIGQAHADDRFFFRAKGVVRETETPFKASMSVSSDKYRLGTPISGSISSTLPNTTWSFEQTPPSPSLSLAHSDDALSGTAPTLAGPVEFLISATATAGKRTTNAQASLTVYPKLALSGGPSGKLKSTVRKPFPSPASFLTVGLVGEPAYSVLQGGSSINLAALCPGLSISSEGVISGTPTDVCAPQGLKIRITDAFDATFADSGTFEIEIAPLASSAYGFGNNSQAQLGDGSITSRSSPVGVVTPKKFLQVAAGYNHNCAVAEEGTVWCWGNAANGKLGNGQLNGYFGAPVQVQGLTGARAVAAGISHSCAITATGTFCWGFNAQGQLGVGSSSDSPNPLRISSGLTNPSAIFANGNGTCVIDGGAAKCWGAKAGNVANQSSTPYLMPELASGVTSIGMGFDQSCAVANGGVKCWGSNGNGHIPGRPSDSNTPIAVAGLSGVTMLAVSSTHACAVASGVTKCWGTNASGQFGTGAVSGAKSAPVDVVGLLGQPSNITAGDGYTCANIGGSPYCWGANGSGQLGDGTTVQKTAPTKVIAIASMQKVVAGYNFTMAW